MSAGSAAVRRRFRLPELEAPAAFGGGLVRWTVAMTLTVLGVIASAAVAALFTVTLDLGVDAAGVLEPRRTWPVRSPVDGVVHDFAVTAGDRVEIGQTVARLDVYALTAELEKLRLEADLEWSRQGTPRRERELLAQRISQAEEELRRRTLTAPGAGVVLTEELDDLLGSRVDAGALVLEIGALDAWRAELQVRELDIHQIRLGDPVRMVVRAVNRVEGWQDRRLSATIVFVGADPIPGVGGDGRSRYRVLADLEPGSIAASELAKLKRGMSVEARVITRSARAVDLLVRHIKAKVGGG